MTEIFRPLDCTFSLFMSLLCRVACMHGCVAALVRSSAARSIAASTRPSGLHPVYSTITAILGAWIHKPARAPVNLPAGPAGRTSVDSWLEASDSMPC
jgi:hypothetical protein